MKSNGRVDEWLFGNPVRAMFVYMALSAILWTLQCCVLQNVLGGDALETITWGAQKTWGHWQHPPLSGWIGHAAAVLSGYSDWGSYLLCQLCLICGVSFSYLTMRQFWDRHKSATGAMLLYFLFDSYNPGWMRFSTYDAEIALFPIAFLLFFSAASQDAAWRATTRTEKLGEFWRWLIFGFVSGLGMLNKYSFGLFLAGAAVYMLIDAKRRGKLLTPGPWLALIVFTAVIFPHVEWLTENDFCCLGHVNIRMHEKHDWTTPFVAFGTAVYPLLLMGGVLLITWFLGRRETGESLFSKRMWSKKEIVADWRNNFPRMQWKKLFSKRFWLKKRIASKRRNNFPHWIGCPALFCGALCVTGIPKLALIAMAAAGSEVIMKWFSTMESLSGAFLLAALPASYAVGRKFFRTVWWLLVGFTMLLYIAQTAYTALATAPRLHSNPEVIKDIVLDHWHKFRPGEMPRYAIANRWYAQLMENYSKGAIRGYDTEDEITWKLYGDDILEHGAIMLGDPENTLEFYPHVNYPVTWEKRVYSYKSLLGPMKRRSFHVAYFPSARERELESKKPGFESRKKPYEIRKAH
ncbi:MAG: glycosyltransferase family 39 protein [Victivallaceae bacterium]|nr:glycosyltransferase family 39 protein [Victivallaceae bacterium]